MKPNQTLEITWSDGEGSIAFAVINPLDATLTVAPPAGWEAYQITLQGEDAPVSQLSSGEFQVMPRSATLIVRTASASPSKESIPAMSAEETEARSEEPVLAEAAGDRLDAENNHRVFYEIFVGSFSDSDGDGVGDLRGIINRMDYLNDGDPASGKSLGVEGLWLTPIFSSPSYHKYNVTDYYTIDPVFGTEEDLRELIALCHARDVKLILDLPLNHTGSDHRWYKQFLNAHQMDSTDNIYYDLYSWIGPDETPPAGRHFSSVPRSDLKVETNFSDSMPEWNFDSDSVRQEALNIARYYLDMGVDGFRFDAAKYLYLGEHEKNIEFWTWYIRELKKINPNVYTVAEVWDGEGVTNRYAAAVNCFNFSTSQAEGIIAETAKGGNVNAFASAMESTLNTLAAIRPDAMNIPFISNHDTDRAAGYLTMASGRMQMAASLYLLTPGSPFIYYGEEIGLRGSRGGANTDANRRLAMRWGDGDPIQDPAGSTYDKQTPYTVQDLENMPGSLLRHYRKLLKIRKDNPEIARGTFTALSFPDSKAGGFLCSWNGSTVAVLHNTTEKTQKLDLKAACDLPFTAIAAVVEALYGEGGAELDGTVLTLYPQTTVVLR